MLECFPRRNLLILFVADSGVPITNPHVVQEQITLRIAVLVCKYIRFPVVITVRSGP